MQLLDRPIYQSFVSPDLCKQLHGLGLTHNTHFHFVVRNGGITINTYAFDKDDYYALGDKGVDSIMPPDEIIPAYQLKDIEKVIPAYLLSRSERGYELMCENLYGLPSQTADRMPDVFAHMLIDGLKSRIIKIEMANNFITRPC